MVRGPQKKVSKYINQESTYIGAMEVLNGTPMGVSTRTYWHPQGVSIRTYWHPLEIIMELLNQLILNLSRVQGVLQGVLQGYYVMILLGVLQWVAI